ncbi:hypothetical protein [Streptomyces sp. BF23-19]|uniref:hypothetical protein n=1 Tax=unclassified Streptomyces TaxID=2593676 RepID=UPI0034E52A2E
MSMRLEAGGRVVNEERRIPCRQALRAGYEQRLAWRVQGPDAPGPEGLLTLSRLAGAAGDQDGHGHPDDVADTVYCFANFGGNVLYLYRRRDRSGIPEVPAFAFRDPGGAWTISARCPFCLNQHLHGARHGPAPSFPADKVRCGGRTYSLMPMEPTGS